MSQRHDPAHAPLNPRALLIPNAESAIINTTAEGRAVYSYELLVDHFYNLFRDPTAPDDHDPTEAVDWIWFNVLPGLKACLSLEYKEEHLTPYIVAEYDPEQTPSLDTPLEELCLVRDAT